jgi:hypothetical protein
MTSNHVHPLVWVIAVCGGLAALFAVGCGGDSDPEKVAIEASGSGKEATFTAPSEVKAGVAEIEFTNSSEQENDAQLVKIEGDYTEEQVIAELGKATESEPVEDWFQAAGGVGSTPPGETNSVEQELSEGTYYVVGQNKPATPLTKIEVTANGDADLEQPEAKVTAQEYSFSAEGLKSGEQQILLDNAGAQWHHFIAQKIAEGKTLEDVKGFFEGGGGNGPPPIDQKDGFTSTVLEGGESQVVTEDLTPGQYAFFCAVSDKQGGPPHFAKGMISEVTVEE